MNVDFDPAVVISFLRGVVTELREKRLWPVAVVLLLAIVAVPVLLSKSSAATPVAQVPQPAPPPSAAASLPALSVQSTPAQSRLTGRARNPFAFAQQAAGRASTAAAAAGTTATTTAAATTGTAASPSGTTPSSGTSTSSSTTTPTITYFYFAVDLAFGKFGTPLKTYTNAARLRIFPSATTPVVVYLGLKSDAKTAVFLVSSAATATGTGKCIPSARYCAFLDLKVGQGEVFLIQKADGSVVPYELEVTAVRLVQASSAAAAAHLANGRVSRSAQKMVASAQRLAPDLPWPSYSAKTGFLSSPTTHRARSAQRMPDVPTGAPPPARSGQ